MDETWEYKFERLTFPKRKNDDRSVSVIEAEWLNEHGAQGWRLKEKSYSIHNDVLALFERKVVTPVVYDDPEEER